MVKNDILIRVRPKTHTELMRISKKLDLKIPQIMDMFTNDISRFDFKTKLVKVKRKGGDVGFDQFI